MRKYVFAAFAAACMVIVAPASGLSNPDREESLERAALAVQSFATGAGGVRDEAAMVLVGTALIAVAAAVRRAA
jgi:hypothetical protein